MNDMLENIGEVVISVCIMIGCIAITVMLVTLAVYAVKAAIEM